VNIKSETRSVNIEANHDVRLMSNQADVMLTASRAINLKTINGPTAAAIPEKAICTTDKGWVYEWSEKSGSSTCSINIDSGGDVNTSASQNLSITSKASFNARSMNANLSIQAPTININADASVNFTAPDIGLEVVDGIEGIIPVFAKGNADTAAAASSATPVSTVKVTDHMIQPDHEPWVRDADEAKCKTPRNKKYQG